MAVALASVAATTRSILLRDTDQRINGLLAQEAGEFANFEEQGFDPETGAARSPTRCRLLRVFLERQYADLDEELVGLVGEVGGRPTQIIQQREIPVDRPLHEDADARRRIYASPDSTGVLDRPEGEIRWAKVTVARYGGEPAAAFVVAFHPGREQARVDEVFRVLLAISGVALLMTTGIAWVVAGRILKPVRAGAHDRGPAHRAGPDPAHPGARPRRRGGPRRDVQRHAGPAGARLRHPAPSSSTTRATSCAPRSPSCAATWS